MNKRNFQNCVSKEKKIYEANVKKYRKFMEKECADRSKLVKILPVPMICSARHASTSLGSFSTEEPLRKTPKNTDILALLQQLVEGQQQIMSRLEGIELNQVTLSQGQATLNAKQEEIMKKLMEIEASAASKPEMVAQSKLMIENKVAIGRAQVSLCRITGETNDKTIDEVASMFPLRTIAAVQEVEDKLGSPEFTQAMNTYMYKIKGVSEEVGSVIRVICTDDLLEKYNWDGRWEKQSLAKLILFNKILKDIFQKQGALEFAKNVRKAVEHAHHRVNQKKYLKNK